MPWVGSHPTVLCEEVVMGFRNFGSLIIIFLILMMVFGTQRLRDIGNDLAVAIRSFRKGLNEDENEKEKEGNREGNKA
jgi:sec-independent protein translocase protein TatA